MSRKLIAIVAALLMCAGLASAAPIHDAAAKGDDAKLAAIGEEVVAFTRSFPMPQF